MKKNVVVLFYPSPWPDEQRGRIPYALLYLERMLRDLDLEIVLIDEQVNRDYENLIRGLGARILLAGVSSMTGDQILGGMRFSRLIKELSNALVVWGGWHPTLLPEQTLLENEIDLAILGQGEISLRQMAIKLLDGQFPEGIPGTAYKRDGEVVVVPSEQFVDINTFPDLDFGLLDLNDYVFKPAYAQRCVGYFCSHGCPFNCAFCCVATVYGRRWYKKDVAKIIEDLRMFKERTGIDSVTFDDDNFFVSREFAIEFCQAMKASGLELLWDTSAHAATFLKHFSDDDVCLMYEAGCRQIYVGAESGSQEILDLISKGATVEDNLSFVKVLRRHGIVPMLSTMICFPINCGDDVGLTIDMVRRAKLIDPNLRARIFFYTPYPGTELYALAEKNGFRAPQRLLDWPRHTLRKFRAPWANKDFRWDVEIFANFYFPLSSPQYYKSVPAGRLKPILFLINLVFFPFAYLRMRLNCFRCPLEALVFLGALRFFNKIMKTSYSLGFESYLD